MKLFEGIDELYTLSGVVKKQGRRVDLSDMGRIKKGVLLTEKGRIVYAGSRARLPKKAKIKSEIDLGGGIVLPGFVECHTHSVFAGDRCDEFEMRNQGVSYQEIASRGGGILSTMKKTRSASEKSLLETAQKYINNFSRQGVSTVEVKSGYALTVRGESKMLDVAGQLKGPQIIRTYLGAHAFPDSNDKIGYQKTLMKSLESFRSKADRVDIFIEKNYFDLTFAKTYLARAKQLGFGITIHADQLTRTKAALLGVELGASSIDHLVQISKSDVQRIASSETTAVLLPAADFYLKMKYPPARSLIDAGARVAIATDFNPGSSPTQSIEFTGVLSRLEMQMSLPETVAAYTFNAAQSLGLNDRGALVTGFRADFAQLKMEFSELFYQIGSWHCSATYVAGKCSRLKYRDA